MKLSWISVAILLWCSSGFADAILTFSSSVNPLFATVTLQGPVGPRDQDGPELFRLLGGRTYQGGGSLTRIGTYPNVDPTVHIPMIDFTCNVGEADPSMGACTIRIFRSSETVIDEPGRSVRFETHDPSEIAEISRLFSATAPFLFVSSDSQFQLSMEPDHFSISCVYSGPH